MNKTIQREIIDIADTVALVALCGGDSAGNTQLQVEIDRLGATYALNADQINKARAQIITRLARQYQIRGL